MAHQSIVYVTGHRHPDTDSIVSAIAYSLLQQRKGIVCSALPLRQDQCRNKVVVRSFWFCRTRRRLKMLVTTIHEIDDVHPPSDHNTGRRPFTRHCS